MRHTPVTLLSTLAVLWALISTQAVPAQKQVINWMEMSKKDAEHILSESPWSHTQVDTDVSEMFYSPTTAGTGSTGRSNASRGRTTERQSVSGNRSDRGAVNQAVNTSYRICFLSAMPVRQAFARMIFLSQPKVDNQLLAQLQAFVSRDFTPFIVISVNVESSDSRFSGPIKQIINSATTGVLKNKAYLERPDGKRLFLIDYKPPIEDGLGAKFIFPRQLDGRPFLTADSESVRFVAEFNESFKLNMKYKLADMVYQGKLEY